MCDAYKLLVIDAGCYGNDTKATFENFIINTCKTEFPAVWHQEGGKAFDAALNNGGAGNPQYLIRPDKTFKKSPTASEINTAGGNVQHVCNDQQAPTVSVTSPGNSDVLMVGTEHEITYTAEDNVGVVARAIYFSSDNGSNWALVDSSTDNTGSFAWTVPDEVSEECKIKILAYDAAGNVGNSESEVFEIEPASTIIYHSEIAADLIKFKKTSGSYMVYIPFEGNYTVTISDVHGRTLSSFSTGGNKQWYDVSKPVTSGVHIVSVEYSDKTFVKKFWFVK